MADLGEDGDRKNPFISFMSKVTLCSAGSAVSESTTKLFDFLRLDMFWIQMVASWSRVRKPSGHQ